MGFDEIRVRFRAERRRLLCEIIVNLIKGKELETYILQKASKLVPSEALNDLLKMSKKT